MRTFIATHSSDHRVLTRNQIYREEELLGYSRVRASTQAMQALTPINVVRAFNFWTQPWPVGRMGLSIADLKAPPEPEPQQAKP